MVQVLFWANVASALAVLFWYFNRPGGYIACPFLISLVYLAWYLPQARALIGDTSIYAETLAKLLGLSLMSFWALCLGWHKGLGKWWRRPRGLYFDTDRLFWPVLAITLVSMAMTILIESRPVSERAQSQWSGPLTIFTFFASIGVVSLALSTAMVLQTRNVRTLGLLGLNAALFAPKVFILFRRADTFEVMITILMALLFVRGWTLPRAMLIAGGVAGFFFINGIGHLRALGGGYDLNAEGQIERRVPTLSEIASIDWSAAVDQDARTSMSEVRNAVVYLDVITYTSSISLGAQFWNRLVLQYVPGQIVGRELKSSLLIGTNLRDLSSQYFGFEKALGTTWTGFIDPFRDFWYFGVLVFWLTGYAMARMLRHAVFGSVAGYTLYAATLTNTTHAITHYGYYLFSQSVLIFVTVALVRWWIRRRPPRRAVFSTVREAI